MANIGFVHRKENGDYVGRLTTLSIDVEIRLQPINKTKENAPDYRIMAGRAEVGAAWIKISENNGNSYISLTIDTPELPRRINAQLAWMAGQDDPDLMAIIWNRRKRSLRTTCVLA